MRRYMWSFLAVILLLTLCQQALSPFLRITKTESEPRHSNWIEVHQVEPPLFIDTLFLAKPSLPTKAESPASDEISDILQTLESLIPTPDLLDTPIADLAYVRVDIWQHEKTRPPLPNINQIDNDLMPEPLTIALLAIGFIITLRRTRNPNRPH